MGVSENRGTHFGRSLYGDSILLGYKRGTPTLKMHPAGLQAVSTTALAAVRACTRAVATCRQSLPRLPLNPSLNPLPRLPLNPSLNPQPSLNPEP